MKLHRKKVYPIVAVFSIAGIFVRGMVFPELGLSFHVTTFFAALFFVPMLVESMVFIHNRLDRIFPYDIRQASAGNTIVRRIIAQILIGIALYACLAALAFWLYKDFIPLVIQVPMLTKPFIVAALIANILGVLAVNLGLFGKEFFDRWKKELLNSERLKKERAQMQFDNLRNQLNPHFLFNSLTSLNSLIFENPQLASEFLQQLAKVYRYVLQHTNRDTVTLYTEVGFIRRYVMLLETRFGEGLKVNITLDKHAEQGDIPPVTLQILIENAIKHNIATPEQPLHITIFNNSQYLCISNNIQRKKLVEGSNKQGLENLKHLYRYLSPLPVLILEENATFTVQIPLL